MVCNMAKSKLKQFWKTIKKKFTNSKSVQSDSLTVDDLFHHFKSIYGIESDPLREQPLNAPPTETQANTDIDVEISENELKMRLFLRKITKVRAQIFYVPNYFKSSFDIIKPFLLKLYNRLLINREYPRLWGEGHHCPYL